MFSQVKFRPYVSISHIVPASLQFMAAQSQWRDHTDCVAGPNKMQKEISLIYPVIHQASDWILPVWWDPQTFRCVLNKNPPFSNFLNPVVKMYCSWLSYQSVQAEGQISPSYIVQNSHN